MEIEFCTNHQPNDDLSALSRSIGKQWEDDESMIVWETNDQEIDANSKISGHEDQWEEEQNFDTDQEAVRQLQEKLRDRESKDTNSVE